MAKSLKSGKYAKNMEYHKERFEVKSLQQISVDANVNPVSRPEETSKNLLGFVAPWKNPQGDVLRPLEVIKTRKFTITYLLIIWAYVILIDEAPEGDIFYNLRIISEQFARMDSNELTSNPLVFLLSLLLAPFAHWDTVHAIYVSAGIMFFLQSFEAHNNWKKAAIIFIGTSALTSLIMAIFYNVGFAINPDVELFSRVMSRSFRGGSIGMFGALGALAYHARKPHVLLLLVLLFEAWNYTSYGTDAAISIGHASSTLIGLVIWIFWNKKGSV